MPQDLQSIVQRMVEAGESEENIAAVVQHYKAPPKAETPVSVRDMLPSDVPSDPMAAPRMFADIAKGAKAGVLSTVFHGGDLIRRGLGMNRVIETPDAQAVITPPNTEGGTMGFAGEQALEYAAPLTRVAGALRGAGPLTRAAAQGSASAGVAGMQSGGDPKTMAVAGALGAAPSAIGGVLQLARNSPDLALRVIGQIPGLKTPVRTIQGLRQIGPVVDTLTKAIQGLTPAAKGTTNTGGKLVKAPPKKPVEDVMAEALGALRAAKPPAGTLPPPKQLPPGYSPRSSAPAPKTPPAAAPAQSSPELPASWQQFATEPAERSGAAATGPLGPRKVTEELSAYERDALKRELRARGGTPDISADDAARYLREYGQLIPPGTRQARQGRHIEDALGDQRYRFHLENPASALALMTGGAAAFRERLLSLLSGEERP